MTTFNPPLAGQGSASTGARDRDVLRHELVDAQVQVLNMYLDKRSAEDMVAALDRLIQCSRASFAAEEALMVRLRGQADPAHRDRHTAVLDRLDELRLTLLDTDRGRLLANLILIDRELIAHVADARKTEASEDRSVPIRSPAVTRPELQH